jgi:hypothetical protein
LAAATLPLQTSGTLPFLTLSNAAQPPLCAATSFIAPAPPMHTNHLVPPLFAVFKRQGSLPFLFMVGMLRAALNSSSVFVANRQFPKDHILSNCYYSKFSLVITKKLSRPFDFLSP